MSHDLYYQFVQSPEQVRRVGARGGKATVRNRRQRLQSGQDAGAPHVARVDNQIRPAQRP